VSHQLRLVHEVLDLIGSSLNEEYIILRKVMFVLCLYFTKTSSVFQFKESHAFQWQYPLCVISESGGGHLLALVSSSGLHNSRLERPTED